MIIPHHEKGIMPVMQRGFNMRKLINVTNHINRTKDKSHITISIDIEKHDKIQHLFMINIQQSRKKRELL